MKTIISSFILLLGLLFACSPNPKQESVIKPTADTIQQPENPVPQAWNKITSMVGEYMYDSVVFKFPAVRDSLKAILGPEYQNMVANWNVASELQRTKNILYTSGCKRDACFSNMWILMIDIANSLVNVYHMQDHKLTIYKGRELIDLPDGLQEYINRMKTTGHVAEGDVVIQ